jgi:hypothetical protein
MTDVIACPRCEGTWWRWERFSQIPKAGQFVYGFTQTKEMETAILEGRETPGGAIPVVAEPARMIVVCGQCSFPKVEPHKDGPWYEQGAGR